MLHRERRKSFQGQNFFLCKNKLNKYCINLSTEIFIRYPIKKAFPLQTLESPLGVFFSQFLLLNSEKCLNIEITETKTIS